MPFDPKVAMQEIDAALAPYTNLRAKFSDLSDEEQPTQHRVASLMGNTLLRLAPPGSYYASHTKAMQSGYGQQPTYLIPQFKGMLESLRDEYAAGSLRTVAELIHADLFADF